MYKKQYNRTKTVLFSGLFLISGLQHYNALAIDLSTNAPLFIPRGYSYETYYDTKARDQFLNQLKNSINNNNASIAKLGELIETLKNDSTQRELNMYKLYKEREELQDSLKQALPQYLSLKSLQVALEKNKVALSALRDLLKSAQQSPLDEQVRDFIARYLESDQEHRHALKQELNELIAKEAKGQNRENILALGRILQNESNSSGQSQEMVRKSFEDLRLISKNHTESLNEISNTVEDMLQETEEQIKHATHGIKEIHKQNESTNFERIEQINLEIKEQERIAGQNYHQAKATTAEILRLMQINKDLEAQKVNAPKPKKKTRRVDYDVLQ